MGYAECNVSRWLASLAATMRLAGLLAGWLAGCPATYSLATLAVAVRRGQNCPEGGSPPPTDRERPKKTAFRYKYRAKFTKNANFSQKNARKFAYVNKKHYLCTRF